LALTVSQIAVLALFINWLKRKWPVKITNCNALVNMRKYHLHSHQCDILERKISQIQSEVCRDKSYHAPRQSSCPSCPFTAYLIMFYTITLHLLWLLGQNNQKEENY
jgi:hypothetical protein